ncbi:SDR family NAD(P)-dependent oxidoreductase [Humibacillus xanthopallidus]|uniref:NAD(P)-dependent dehydrogenase (Short-subunit alcohol dehydrogenase family) n=1 Tax=Humibacillus xanthopallidus TaxID=412689 RepID=A0A543HTU4_9MICO|nr:SDR family oxidoreductase [Humibacillus xanthopallidus]TQM61781.1 NAD(P)-dependent dehydrogenase (short-subunit alcohol dehydrogenase family) [Humibacillus xanthopallidus]
MTAATLPEPAPSPPDGRVTRSAVVTGASSGIGLAIAHDLVGAGWHVLGLSRSRGALPDAATWVPCDLADVISAGEAVQAVREAATGGVDAIVHAAGLQFSALVAELRPEQGERMWAVHVRGAELVVGGLVETLCDGGRVVLVGSRTMTGVPGKSQYAATKAALTAMARSWAAELAPRRITVNVVAPGPTRTAMLDDPNRASVPPVVPPLGRLVEPAEIAALTRFLLEPAGAMVTGQTIVICGGASLP